MTVRARRLPIAVCAALAVLSILLCSDCTGSAHAQEVSRSFAQGTHLFRRLLYDLHLQPLHHISELREKPADNQLLIILGEAEYLHEQNLLDLEEFMERGGAVLLATDRECSQLLQRFHVRVNGDRMTTREPKSVYKGAWDCIFVKEPQAKNGPLFANLALDENRLSRVATNRAGFLVYDQACRLSVLATFPRGCWPIEHRRMSAEQRAKDQDFFSRWLLPFAMGGDRGRGRILILSDHSVFINAMMWQPDLDNFDFAYNCVNWLTAKGSRTQVLFLEEGQIQGTFQIPLKQPPVPPLPPLKAVVEAMDERLGELEKENTFNRAIHKAVADVTEPGEKWVQAVVLMSTVALGVFGLSRLTQARHRREKVSLPADAVRERMPAATTLLEQRHQAMLRDSSLWESARALARQGLESLLGPQFRTDLPTSAEAAPPLPPSWTNGGWWRRWRLRRHLHRLWRLAYGTEPVSISSRQLRRLGREIEQMKTFAERADRQEDGRVTR